MEVMKPYTLDEFGTPLFTHFSHLHLMYFSEIFSKYGGYCYACQSLCLGSPAYYCRRKDCEYYLHKRCFECPSTEATPTTHHEHPIVLRVLRHDEKNIVCESCKRNTCLFVFQCSKSCNDWNLCIDCYLLPKYLDNYYFHTHDDHPNLSLSISPNCVEFTCSLCHFHFKSSTPRFGCTKCSFVVDVECGLAPPIKHEGEGNFRHFTHPHQMTLVNQSSGDEVNEYSCFACGLPCRSSLAHFSCIDCNYFLHKSCAEFPLRIQCYPLVDGYLPFHVKPQENDYCFCALCGEHRSGFHFVSSNPARPQSLCSRCMFSRTTIKHEGHPHLLWLDAKVGNLASAQCNAGYDNYCKLPVTSLEARSAKSSMYRCLECNFKSHLLCGPLPSTIKYECHIHPLVLVDLLVNDHLDEKYCDICEDKRDPRIHVYHCHECKYQAHVHCLFSQIVTTLRGDQGNLRLKAPKINERHDSKVPKEGRHDYNFKEYIWETLNGDEKVMLWCDLDIERIGFHPPLDLAVTVRLHKLARFSADYFEKFIDWLAVDVEFEKPSKRRLRKTHSLLHSGNFVSVDGYKVPASLAEYLVRLLGKYGDISSNSKSTQGMKSIAFCFLCRLLFEIDCNRIHTIILDELKEWYFYVNYAKRRGFDVKFMFDHLKNVVRGFIAIQAAAERNGCGTWDVREKNIRELQDEVNLIKSGRSNVCSTTAGFVKWGEFLMECLSMAIQFSGTLRYPLLD